MTLAIQPLPQQQTEWCWLASAEMIFRHYGVPQVNPTSYQCGIIAMIYGPNSACWTNCAVCDVSSGTEQEAAAVLMQYPALIEQVLGQPSPQLRSSLVDTEASIDYIMQTISSGNPIELGVTPSGPFTGVAGHAIVLVGYDATTPGVFRVIINDPYPYPDAQNPFLLAGATPVQPLQYEMEISAFAQALQWSATISVARYQ